MNKTELILGAAVTRIARRPHSPSPSPPLAQRNALPAMAHTFMHRTNALLTFAGTVLAGMCVLATLTGERDRRRQRGKDTERACGGALFPLFFCAHSWGEFFFLPHCFFSSRPRAAPSCRRSMTV